MSTILIAYRNAKQLGRCDKNCYDAKRPKCTCICQGTNHGAGLHVASLFNTALLDEITQELRKRFPRPDILRLYQVRCHLPRSTVTLSVSPPPEISDPLSSTLPEDTGPSGT